MMPNISLTETEILDTTLREGEQCYGVFFPLAAKKRIALLLDGIGVHFIEVGHPAAAPSIKTAVAEIAGLNLRSRLIAHARLNQDEIRLVKDLGLRWVGLFCGINERSQRRYNLTKPKIFKKIEEAVSCAKALDLSIKFSCEDASRTGVSELVEFYSVLASLGVDRLSFADTLGILRPEDIERFNIAFGDHFPFNKLHFHFHDDSGFANHNAIRAIECGARCIDTSISGIGERMGLPSLESILAFLNARSEIKKYDTSAIRKASDLVGRHINYNHFVNRRFAHKSGIHINGIIKDAANYEFIDPELAGSERFLVLSKLIGISGLRMMLLKCGFTYDDRNLQSMLAQVKSEDTLELADVEQISRYFAEKGLERHRV